eukprot:TRINITY_DN121549_c0_g1_i1.p1 TRINITY_DN121549_c0_g1~~TRINITY_DN121549_c0_g1_i1.p1  ORF type:complete len:678 (+),score=179.30 TRINITY_DN121549_c0_g1_i1:127-2160(+)
MGGPAGLTAIPAGMETEVPWSMPDWPESMPADFPSLPPDVCGVPQEVFHSLCKRLMSDIHMSHTMSPEEKEAKLRRIAFRVPGAGPERSLLVLEDPTGVWCPGATGAVLWPAAGGLIEWLDRVLAPQAKAPRRRRAIELGAGLGAVGLFLARHKDCDVVVTETDEALPLLRRNVEENYSPGESTEGPQVLPLQWGNEAQINACRRGEAFDYVVGSDITYRPECMSHLLGSAEDLLEVGGRLMLTLQDRTGEAAELEAAVARHGCFKLVSCCEAPPAGLLAVENATVEAGAIPFGADDPMGRESLPKVWLYEFELKERPKKEPTPSTAMWLTPADVEAEFERLTGVKVDPVFADGKWLGMKQDEAKHKADAQKKPKSKSAEMKEKLIADYLERGLGASLCDLEEVAQHIASMPEARRPETDGQKESFAKAYYEAVKAGKPPPAVWPPEGDRHLRLADIEKLGNLKGFMGTSEDREALAALEALEARERRAQHRDAPPPLDTGFAAGAGGYPSSPSKKASTSPTAAAAAEEPEVPLMPPLLEVAVAPLPACRMPAGGSDGKGAEAKMCLEGLEWNVDINEADQRLTATITFRQEVWQTLQGDRFDDESAAAAKRSTDAFRDMVDFELAEQELRVKHEDATVLELRLPRLVEPNEAAAKICGRRRRVTVRAPLVAAPSMS